VDEPVPTRTEGETTIIPVMEEVLVVEKRLRLKEELHVTRRRTEHRDPQRVTLRSERVEVERTGPDMASPDEPH
jgi:stress response protein YsnF